MPDSDIQQFIALTNCSTTEANKFLAEFDGNLERALNAYFAQTQNESESNNSASKKELPTDSLEEFNKMESSSNKTGSKSRSIRKETPRFKTFAQILKESQGEEDGDDESRHTFAGGETSGLEVTDPNDLKSLIRDLLEKARKSGESANTSELSAPQRNSFTGTGYRLGSFDSAPEVVSGQHAPPKPKKVTREITFWKEGFQVGEDGPLYRYDNSANSYYLNELNQGRAPLKLLDVEFGQEVDVNVYKKLEESYKPPKRKLRGLGGTGRRLGSSISENNSPIQTESNLRVTPEASSSHEDQSNEKEKPKGNTSIQIRYADGRREILSCDKTDTVQYIYDYIQKNTNAARSFTLNQAMPIKVIDQYDSTVEKQNLCNSVIVQRWV